ncbi:hypothetical protein KJ830_04470, partial [bacterium]|nr:hypothetical protein [bacterium]
MKLTRWKLVYIFLFIFLIFQTNMVLANNIVVPHEWYRYQGASDSDKKGNDCGPACVAMAIQFIKNTFVPIRDIRNYIGPNTATSEQLKNSLQHWGISYNHLSAGSQNVIDAVNNRNHIVICPVKMLCFSPGLDIDPESDDPALNYDRYCSFTEELQGHFIVVKGISDDGNWIIVYDPGVWGSYPYPKYWYSNREPKGKERYYKLSEFSNAINSRGIEILAEPHPIITSPLKISPSSPYCIGDTINAEFSITNENATPLTFTVLTVGGRDPDNHVSDFTIRQNITLEPSKPYNYQGTLTLNKVGDYHFFCTYQTPDGNWNTTVDLGAGLVDEDRTEDISVEEKEIPSVTPDISEELYIEWDKTFGGSNDDGARSIVQTTDGGYAIAGYTSSKGAGKEDIWVIRLDPGGNMLWDKTFGGSDLDVAYSIIQTTDGGYVVAGLTESKGAGEVDAWVIKLDHGGNIVWDKTFGGSEDEFGKSIIQTIDGDYIVAGSTRSKGAGSFDAWVIKLDHGGNIVWDKTFGKSGYDWANHIIQTTDGGYAIAGYTSSKGAGELDAWVIKLDHGGNIVWDKTFGGSEDDWAGPIIQTINGDYIVAGSTKSKGAGSEDIWLMKLDHEGNMLWDKTFGGSDRDFANSIIKTTDKGYMLAGFTFSKGAGGYDAWIIKLSSKSIEALEEEITEVSNSKNYFPLDEGKRWEYQFFLKTGEDWNLGPVSKMSGERILTNFPQRELKGEKVTPQQREDKV